MKTLACKAGGGVVKGRGEAAWAVPAGTAQLRAAVVVRQKN